MSCSKEKNPNLTDAQIDFRKSLCKAIESRPDFEEICAKTEALANKKNDLFKIMRRHEKLWLPRYKDCYQTFMLAIMQERKDALYQS